MSENRVKRAIDTDLSGLYTTAWQREQIVQMAMEGHSNVKYRSKMRVGLVLALALTLMAVTAVAVGLTSYFDGFMGLEETYGDFDQWPGSAKVQLVEIMLDSGALTAEDVPQWRDDLTGEDREAAAEEILADYFDGMLYIDSYNVMERELGPIETWTDEQRAMLTKLQEKHGKWTPSWPVYKVPGTGDLTRDQAVARAKEALLAMFDIDPDYLNALPLGDNAFRAEWNPYGIPEDEPYWTIEIGYGAEGHWVNMTRDGQIITLSAPSTGEITWNEDILAQSTLVEPGEYDATREEAIFAARSPLTELGSFNLSYDEVDEMTATAQLLWNDHYQNGNEPVWVVTWIREGEPRYQVLLTYDAHTLDAVHYGKLFSNVLRREPHLDDLVASMLGVQSYELMDLRRASLEDKATFYDIVKPIAEQWAQEHPYFASSKQATAMDAWRYTRNVLGIPDGVSIDASQALSLALDAFEEKYGFCPARSGEAGVADPAVFYITTNPDQPQWRFIHARFSAAVDAHTGDVLCVYNRNDHVGMEDFIGEIIE